MPPRKKVAEQSNATVATEDKKTTTDKIEQRSKQNKNDKPTEGTKKEITSIAESKIFPGLKILYNDMWFVALDIQEEGVLMISADVVCKMKFSDNSDKGSNDWRKSIVRRKLNSEYIQKFNTNDLLPIVSDLVADTGEDNYGICEDLISIPSDSVLRKFHKLIPNYDTWVWSLTPWAIDYSSMSAVSARTQNKTIYSEQANRELGVVVLCVLKKDVVNQLI